MALRAVGADALWSVTARERTRTLGLIGEAFEASLVQGTAHTGSDEAVPAVGTGVEDGGLLAHCG